MPSSTVKLSELPTMTEDLSLTDIFPFNDDPSGSPITKKSTFQKVANLLEKGIFARQVDNVTDLASEEAGTGYVCIVRDLDRGGIFKAVNSGSSDGGIVFSSATSGWTWQRIFDGPVNALWYGVANNDVATATTFQSAIDSSTNKTLYFPKGTYKLETWIKIPSNSHIIFDREAVINRAWDRQDAIDEFGTSKPYGATFWNTNATAISNGETVSPNNYNIIIEGGTIDIDSGSTYRGAHILLYNVQDCEIKNVTFNDLEQDWAIGVFGNRIKIHNNLILNGAELFEDGIHIQGGEEISITGNIVNAGDDALAFANEQNLTIRNCSAVGNVLNSAKAFAIKIRAGYEDSTNPIELLSISGNSGYSGQSRNGNIYIEEIASDNDNPPLIVRDIQIGNNTFRAGTLAGHGGSASGAPYTVTVRNCTRINFTGLSLKNSLWSSVRLYYARNIKFFNCNFPEPELASTGFYAAHIERCHEGIDFIGCTFENGSESVIYIENSDHINLTGCKINGITSTFSGLQIESLGAIINLNNNEFYGTGGNGINIDVANVEELSLIGNRFDADLTSLSLYSSTQPNVYICKGNYGIPDTNEDTIYIPATSIGVTAGSPTLGTSGSRIPAYLLDASTDEIGGMMLGLNERQDWNKFKVRLLFTNNPGDTANVVCQYYYEPISVGEVISTGATTESGTFAVVTTSNEIGRHQFGNTVTKASKDYHFLRLLRDADNVADTYTSDLGLIAVELVRVK